MSDEIRADAATASEQPSDGSRFGRTSSGGWFLRREEGVDSAGELYDGAGPAEPADGSDAAESRSDELPAGDDGESAGGADDVARIARKLHESAGGGQVAEVTDTFRGPMAIAWLDRHAVWGRILPHLERLVQHESQHGMTIPELTRRIRDGQYQVWILGDIKAIFLTCVYQQQNGRMVCSLSWAAGEDALQPDVVLPPIEAYAKQNDCYAVEIMGRKGWERVVRKHGYGPFYVGIIKEL